MFVKLKILLCVGLGMFIYSTLSVWC